MNSTNFFFDVYTKEQLPTYYRQSQNKYTDEIVFNNTNNEEFQLPESAYVVKDVPDYFKVTTNELPKNIACQTINQYPGFLINFANVPSLSDYLNERFGKSSRY